MKTQCPIEITKKLIQEQSITPDDQNCQKIIKNILAPLGFNFLELNKNNVKNLYCYKTNPNQEIKFCFAGHTDVVPEGEKSHWKYSPFTPTIENNTLYGRGAADMKGAIGAWLSAVCKALNANPDLSGIACLFTSDEEGDAHFGTKYALEQIKEQNLLPKLCLVGEPSCNNTLGDQIRIGRRGSISGEIIITGIQGHVAYPKLAKNPIHLALGALDAICKIEFEENYTTQDLAPFSKSSLQFTNLNSGLGVNNVIPEILTARFNIRFSPKVNQNLIQEKIEQVLNSYKLDYKVTYNLSAKPFLTDLNNIQNIISSIIFKHTNQEVKYSVDGGTSDARFFAEHNIKVFEFGLINKTIHKIDENCDINDLRALEQIYVDFIKEFS